MCERTMAPSHDADSDASQPLELPQHRRGTSSCATEVSTAAAALLSIFFLLRIAAGQYSRGTILRTIQEQALPCCLGHVPWALLISSTQGMHASRCNLLVMIEAVSDLYFTMLQYLSQSFPYFCLHAWLSLLSRCTACKRHNKLAHGCTLSKYARSP